VKTPLKGHDTQVWLIYSIAMTGLVAYSAGAQNHIVIVLVGMTLGIYLVSAGAWLLDRHVRRSSRSDRMEP
jgi:hypothetical protein